MEINLAWHELLVNRLWEEERKRSSWGAVAATIELDKWRVKREWRRLHFGQKIKNVMIGKNVAERFDAEENRWHTQRAMMIITLERREEKECSVLAGDRTWTVAVHCSRKKGDWKVEWLSHALPICSLDQKRAIALCAALCEQNRTERFLFPSFDFLPPPQSRFSLFSFPSSIFAKEPKACEELESRKSDQRPNLSALLKKAHSVLFDGSAVYGLSSVSLSAIRIPQMIPFPDSIIELLHSQKVFFPLKCNMVLFFVPSVRIHSLHFRLFRGESSLQKQKEF